MKRHKTRLLGSDYSETSITHESRKRNKMLMVKIILIVLLSNLTFFYFRFVL